jgi:uncharacterized membrane protein
MIAAGRSRGRRPGYRRDHRQQRRHPFLTVRYRRTGRPSSGPPPGGHKHPANQRRHDQRTRSERLADRVTAVFGSWNFIIVQTVIVILWIGVNLAAVAYRWDPYPFILLNLVFSTQAAYAAPLILLSQNRQADTDRIKAERDYEVNQRALLYLTILHRDAARCGLRLRRAGRAGR